MEKEDKFYKDKDLKRMIEINGRESSAELKVPSLNIDKLGSEESKFKPVPSPKQSPRMSQHNSRTNALQ